jgi:hypothetical protein
MPNKETIAEKYYKAHKDLRLVTFSYLSGSDLYHKIGLLDKTIRESLPKAGLLD